MAIYLIDQAGLQHPTAAIWSQFGMPQDPGSATNVRADAFAKLTAQDLMTSPVITLSADCSANDALELFETHHFRHLPIVNLHGHLCGLLSERDLFTWLYRQPNGQIKTCLDQPVSDIMMRQVLVVTPDTPCEVILAVMLYRAIGSVPVVQDSLSQASPHLIGMITKTNMLEHVLDE